MAVVGTGVVKILVVSEPGWNTVFAAGVGADLVAEESDYTEAVAQ